MNLAELTREVPMSRDQEEHLSSIIRRFSSLTDTKYRKGQREHGGDLFNKPGVFWMAMDEVLDLPTYLFTLHDQLAELAMEMEQAGQIVFAKRLADIIDKEQAHG